MRARRQRTDVWALIAAVVACVFVLVGCMSQATFDAGEHVKEQWTRALDDGVVTTDELAEHSRLLGVYFDSAKKDAERTDWGTLIAQVAVGVLTGGGAYFAAKAHQVQVWGTPEKPKPTAPTPVILPAADVVVKH